MTPFMGPNELELTDEVVRHYLGQGERVPLARLTFGLVSGFGWGFLRPWQQLAVFPEKGTPAGIGHRHRHHERFWIRALVPHDGTERHPRHSWTVTGRYWEGVAWRASWRYPRMVLLDPDIITADTHPRGSYGDWLGMARP